MGERELDGAIVAVVDDNEPLLKAMCGFLEACGARVLTYKSSRDFLMEMPFAHCVVIDYYMPHLDGLALSSELRRRGYPGSAIVLTAMSNQIPEGRLADCGVREVVDKYSGSEALLRAIHRYSPNSQ